MDFNKPYDQEEAERVARIQGHKSYGDKLVKLQKELRRMVGMGAPLGMGKPAYCLTVGADIIRSVFPNFQEFQGGADRSSWQVMNDSRALIGLPRVSKAALR